MGAPKKEDRYSDDTFIDLFTTLGATETARRLDITESNVYLARRKIEQRLGIVIKARHSKGIYKEITEEHPARATMTVTDGTVIVGSDAHYYPGVITTAHKALVKFCRKLKPEAVVMNGDIMDGGTISRHPPIGWENRPTLVQEIETCGDRMDEIFKASPNSSHWWPLGNHDARFATRLATVAPEYAKVHGFQLKHHFPGWQPCWSIWVNDSVVIKHRFKGGIHATHNNTIWSGKTIVTGHLHSLKVTPFADYNGNRYGVDTGTLAEPYGPQFGYVEDNPVNWRSGFMVLTFRGGRLLWPEPVLVIGPGEVEFRGDVIRV